AARRRKAKGNGSSPDSESKAHRLLSSARVAEGLGNYAESLKRCNQALKFEGLEIADRIELLMLRARAHYFLGRKAEAIGDWSEVMSLPSVQVNVVAEALIDRGVTWGEMGDTEKEFADYNRVVEQLPGTPVGHVARALHNRAIVWGRKG